MMATESMGQLWLRSSAWWFQAKAAVLQSLHIYAANDQQGVARVVVSNGTQHEVPTTCYLTMACPILLEPGVRATVGCRSFGI